MKAEKEKRANKKNMEKSKSLSRNKSGSNLVEEKGEGIPLSLSFVQILRIYIITEKIVTFLKRWDG